MSFFKDFKEFAVKGNVIDLAVAVVIGGAFGKIVSAFVADIVMPVVSAVMPQGDWRKFEVTPLHIKVGDFVGTIVDFVIVALVIFLAIVKVMGAARRPAPAAEAPATKSCPECLELIPAAARRCRACTAVVAALLVLFAAASAHAQADPKFDFAKPEAAPPPAVEWKAQAKGGLLLTGGNSQTTNGSAGLALSRKANGNKFSFDAMAAYGRSNVLTATVAPADPTIMPPPPPIITSTSLSRKEIVTTNTWAAKARYDRFFTANNAGYVSAQSGGDRVAGKELTGGGQIGYSRQLLKTDMQLVVAEIGYDFSYERYVQQPGKTIDPVSIHSGRVFVGETVKLSSETGATATVEVLSNVSRESKAIDVGTDMQGVDAFHDTRVNARLGVTTTLRKRLSVGLGATLKYDQNPAPLPIPALAPAGAMYAPGYQPFAEKTDVIVEAALVYTLL